MITQLQTLESGIYAVWQSIGFDAMDCVTQQGETISNKEAVEFCIDADRLQTFDQPEAYAIYKSMVAEHGYVKTLKTLSKLVRLV